MTPSEITALAAELATLLCDTVDEELNNSQIPGVSRAEVSTFVRRTRTARMRSWEKMFRDKLSVLAEAEPASTDAAELPAEALYFTGATSVRLLTEVDKQALPEVLVVAIEGTRAAVLRRRIQGQKVGSS